MSTGELVVVLRWLPHFNIPPPGVQYSNNSGMSDMPVLEGNSLHLGAALTIPIAQGGAVAYVNRPQQLATQMVDILYLKYEYCCIF